MTRSEIEEIFNWQKDITAIRQRIQNLEKHLAFKQSTCKHWSKCRVEVDPYDFYYVCEWCGKYLGGNERPGFDK